MAMKRVTLLFVIGAILGLSRAAGLHAQPLGEKLAMSLRDNVVQIVAERPDGSQDGFGFIVGERDKHLYIVTANHVVRGVGPDATASRVMIRYFRDKETAYEAKLLGVSSRTHDLAVLVAPRQVWLQWHRASSRSEKSVQRGTPVWFIGRGGSWYIPTEAGRLNSVTLDFRIRVDGLHVKVGSSGAPLLSENGIIGMVLRDEGDVSEAIDIDIIERAFSLWDLPWDLQPLVARAAIPALLPEIEMHLSAGDRFLKSGNYSKALEEYQAAGKYDGRNTAVLHRIVTTMRMQLWADVGIPVELLPNVRRLNSYQEFAAHADRALQILYQAQGIDAALKRNKAWLLEEAYLYRGRGDWHLALKALEMAREIAPDDPEILSELGLLLALIRFGDPEPEVFQKQYNEGISLLGRAVTAQPDNAVYHRHLAASLKQTNEKVAVREFYRAATLATADNWLSMQTKQGALENLVTIVIRWGETGYMPESDAELAQILEYSRAHYRLWGVADLWMSLILSMVYYDLGNLVEAERVIRETMPENIDEKMTYNNRSWDWRLNLGPHLVHFARILERSASDPVLLLALHLYLGRQNLLGVIVSNATYNTKGVRVEGITGGALGLAAGLQVDDWIRKVEGEDTPTVIALAQCLVRKKAGEQVEFEIERDSTRQVLKAVMTESPRDVPGGFLGASLAWAKKGDYVRTEIVQIQEDSPAQRAGIRSGDILHGLNGITLFGPSHLAYVVAGFRPGVTIYLEIERGGEDLTVQATLAEQPK
jgi:S1-C subfamily serine protease/tetratricopeptide (TPR) repeat protein